MSYPNLNSRLDGSEHTTTVKNFQSLLIRHANEQVECNFQFASYAAGSRTADLYTVKSGQLVKRAMAMAHAMSEAISPGNRVLVICDPGEDYVVAFLGCVLAGVVVVPLPKPATPSQVARIQHVSDDCDAKLAIVSEEINIPGIAVMEVVPRDETTWFYRCLPPEQNGLCYLQYTSGSTGRPKGVLIHDVNLMSNLEAVRENYAFEPHDRAAIWLPPYHDMGLVISIFVPLFIGMDVAIMRPQDFVAKPVRWLELITSTAATITVTSNSGCDLAQSRIRETDLDGLDLSSLKTIICGSEPVRGRTMRQMVQRFSGIGLRRDQIDPSYGMAEAVVFLTGHGPKSTTRVTSLRLDPDALLRGLAIEVAGSEKHIELVGCGNTAAGHEIAIVHPTSQQELTDGRVGEIQISGPSVCPGYWGDKETTNLIERDGKTWLRSGDLGFIRDGDLFVSGRLKDVIIINGANVVPDDVEGVISDDLGLGGSVVFGVDDGSTEQLYVLCQPQIGVQCDPQKLCNDVAQCIRSVFGIVPAEVALVRRRDVFRTTSGKIARAATRNAYLNGSIIPSYVWRKARS